MPAPRRISAKEARANFGDLLGLVYYTREKYALSEQGEEQRMPG
jgi:hypothetical protein